MEFLDFAGLKRPASPNTCLVAPDGLCKQSRPDRIAPVFRKSARELFEVVSRMIRDERSFKQIDEDREALQIRFVAVTSLLRFKDDVDILVMAANREDSPKAPGSTIAVYSRSRLGYSDLGANEKRVGSLLKNLESVTQTP